MTNNNIIINKHGDRITNIDNNRLSQIGLDRVEFLINELALDFNKFDNEVITYAKDNQEIGLPVVNVSTGEVMLVRSMDYSIYPSNISCIDEGNKIFSLIIKQGRNKKYTASLGVVLPRLIEDVPHNVYNLSDVNTIEKALNLLESRLKACGIYIDLDKARLKKVEVNNTFNLEQYYAYYGTVLKLFRESFIYQSLTLSEIMNGKYSRINHKVVDSCSTHPGIDYYSDGSKRVEMKIYDKSKHILDTLNISVNEDLMRFELTVNMKKINETFGKDYNPIDVLKELDLFKYMYNKFLEKLIENTRKLLKDEVFQFDKYINTYPKLVNGVEVPYNPSYTDMLDIYIKSGTYSVIQTFLIGMYFFYKSKGRSNNFKRDAKKLLTNTENINAYIFDDMQYILSNALGHNVDLMDLPKPILALM